ncbi:LysR family transcriptional regulator [Rouxiella silvae]|uniref:LysR family transcriptional regulator n=1 Tax=Rouxiella silvae TaxID=1646373 RepID=A0AA41BVX9_9GAMM|nr:LysR family transcriptional regulator [Rouxiella silvae]MBF6636436.1 LysR family transcriptional regulator [Rouxiella silvae]
MFSSENLKGIDLFVCVADAGSFTAAGKKMNLTSSAISKGIARLESRLKVKLFQRTTRTLSLTDKGIAFYRTCMAVLTDLEEAQLSMQAEDTEPRGRICIDLPAAYGRLHVLPVILKFIENYPLITPHISFSDRFVDPIVEGIDIIVRIGGSNIWSNALGHRYLGAQRVVFCASPAYIKKYGEPKTKEDLEDHHCIVYGEGNGRLTAWHFVGENPNETERRVLPGRIAVGDGEGQLIAALAGHGITQLPMWLIKSQLEEGSLVQVLPNLATDGLAINLAWLKSRQTLPKVSKLLEMLAENLTPSGHKLNDSSLSKSVSDPTLE